MKMKRSLSTPSSRGNKRVKRNNILALSIANMQFAAPSSETLDPLLPDAPSLDQELEDEESQNEEFERQSDADDDDDQDHDYESERGGECDSEK